MVNILLTLAAFVACTIAAPVDQNCTMPTDLFAYCNHSVNAIELDNSVQIL